MAANNSFTNQGATPKWAQNPGILPKKSPLASSLTLPSSPTQIPNPISGSNQPSSISMGSNPGLIKSTPPTAPVAKTVDAAGNTTHYSTKANPSVLEQQKNLNKLGAGLVEDGIVGPKTREAIAKYGNSGNPTPTPEPTAPPAPKPEPIDPASNARRVLEAGKATPLEQGYLNDIVEAKKMQNAGALGQYADAPMYANKSPEELFKGLIQAPDLVGRAQANKSLYDNLGNIFGSASTQGLLGANTIAGRGLSGSSDVLSASINPLFGGVTGTLQEAVSNVVKRITDGSMTYSDALAALSGYGQAGQNALQQALPADFNIAQSNTLAGQQGSVGVNYKLADTALANVENLMEKLNVSQKTNIPLVNKLTQGFSTVTGLGSEETRAVTGAVQSLRNAYASLLASAKGGTPTDYSGQALAEIPDQPTPNDIKAIRHNFEVLGKARADILGNPGQAGTSGGSSGGFGWDALN